MSVRVMEGGTVLSGPAQAAAALASARRKLATRWGGFAAQQQHLRLRSRQARLMLPPEGGSRKREIVEQHPHTLAAETGAT